MKEYICQDCNYITDKLDNYKRHLKRKNKCGIGKWVCECGHKTNDKSNLNKHKKTCKGRAVSRAVLEEKAHKVAELEKEILRLTQQVQSAEQQAEEEAAEKEASDNESSDNEASDNEVSEDETSEDDASSDEESEDEASDDDIILEQSHAVIDETISKKSSKETQKFILQTIGDIDAEKEQVYFFECGPGVISLQDSVEGVLVKLGSTDQPYTRITKHKRDFEGGRLIDSVITNNPKAVERKLKRLLNLMGRFVECTTNKKQTTETEIIAAVSQEDYAAIVRRAKGFAEEYSNNVELLSVYKSRLAEATEELHGLRVQDV